MISVEEYKKLEAELKELVDLHQNKKSVIRTKLFKWKVEFGKNPASFTYKRKSDVYAHFSFYNKKVASLVRGGWKWVDTRIVEKSTIPEHGGAPKGHKSYILDGRNNWGQAELLTSVHPCTRTLTEE